VHGCPIGCVEGGAPIQSVRAQAVFPAALLAGYRVSKRGSLAPEKTSGSPHKYNFRISKEIL